MEKEMTTQGETRPNTSGREQTRAGRWYKPHVDIAETEEGLLLTMDMPGCTTESVSVDFDDGILSVHGGVCARQPQGTQYLIQEYAVGDFRRAFEINEKIDPDQIAAEYINGVLVIRLPRAEAAKPKKIAVTTN